MGAKNAQRAEEQTMAKKVGRFAVRWYVALAFDNRAECRRLEIFYLPTDDA
jgi:hypothetical protein